MNKNSFNEAQYQRNLREESDQSNSNQEGRGGGGVLPEVLYEEAPPQGPTPFFCMYHFRQKRYPFCILSSDKWYPFHIPNFECCIPF